MSDYFADFDEASTASPLSSGGSSSGASGSSSSGFSREVFSEKISGRFRTFFVDMKENGQGHLIKISEKSRGGKKSTIMMDVEDLDALIAALQNARKILA